MKKSAVITAGGGELVIYRSKDGRMNLDVRLERETVWLTQKQMAVLFGKDTDTIGLHIRNIYREKELSPAATAEESSVVQTEGKRLADNALVALTLLLAESRASEKDVICKVIVNLINRENL